MIYYQVIIYDYPAMPCLELSLIREKKSPKHKFFPVSCRTGILIQYVFCEDYKIIP